MLTSNDKALIGQARLLSQQARDPAPHYEHSTIGYNYRMSNIVAAIGRGQLRVLDDRFDARRRIFAYYKEALGNIPGIEFMLEAPYGRSKRWLTVALIRPEELGRDREFVQEVLEEENIEARPVWKPMHLQPVFKDCRCIGGEVAEDLFNRGLCLPSGTAMTQEDLDRVISVILSCKR
jgi:dTDP-4-amino-4,6-dideoxygalactose transaminase